MLDPAVTRHLFVKKSDQEGQKFYYLGEVDPRSARDAEHGGKNVVTVDLVLHSPVEESLFKHLSS